ncbi:MAG TPA: hypothetical protein VJQ46_17360 [Gemmatimonadales bacterium]|nr:hypothetical protein [Gemmatimonadales bacterium]
MTAASRFSLPAVLALAGATNAPAQQPRPAGFRYTTAQLDCATFLEHSRSRLDAETGGRRRHETLTRDGVLRFRARPSGDSVALEAWYDSLALSRRSPETTLIPDTDGLIGGRFRGTLSTDGRYTETARPYIPDDVSEVADVGRTLVDLLPPLPAGPLAVGEQWAGGGGLEIRRIADSSAGGRPIRRLLLRLRAQSDTAAIRGDTTQLPATEVTTEEGQVDWDADRGLVRRTRHIVIETSVPAGGPLKLPFRSRMEQQVELVRGGRACENGESN